jgi:hypothetical protein
MTLDELIRLLRMAAPSIWAINGFGPLYQIQNGTVVFAPTNRATIGQMLRDAEAVFEDRLATVNPGDYPVAIQDHIKAGSLEDISIGMVLSWIDRDALPVPRLKPAEYPDLSDLERLLGEYADSVQNGDDSRADEQWEYAIYREVINTFFGSDFWVVLEANRGGIK